jgi:cytochrome c5
MKSILKTFFFTFFLIWSTLFCCSLRKSLPIAGPVHLSEEEVAGEKIFMMRCERCHPQGEAGLGPGIHWAPGFAKKFQVRHGFGAMPAFNEQKISDQELNQLIDYLKAMKHN